MSNISTLLLLLMPLTSPIVSWAQTAVAAEETPSPRPLQLDEFRPRSTLVVPRTDIEKAKYPVVNVHTHLGKLHNSREQLQEYVAMMDRRGIAVTVNLDGRLADAWQDGVDFLWRDYKDRFVIFVHLDWRGDGDEQDPATWDCQRPDFARRMAQSLALAKSQGAAGLKVFKSLGLDYPDADGSLLKIDDPRWNPIWQACGELQLPVIIHTADPPAFFQPIDEKNERWEELFRHPEWSFYGDEFPSREDLLAARNRVIQRHPQTQFIGAHVANAAEDLALVAQWLEQYPNLSVDITSRIGELGRQPYSARKFFLKYADRIMFGDDGPKAEARMPLYFRFLETFDEYFPYSEQPFPPQGFWNIHGIGLPDDVLRKVYYENALRIIPGVRERWERLRGEQKE